MSRVAEPGQVVVIGVALLLLMAVHSRRVTLLTERHRRAVIAARADGVDQGRVAGMAEAFDVIVEHRQAQPR